MGAEVSQAGASTVSEGGLETPTVHSAQANEPPRPSALVIVGPSGVGKGTLIKNLMDGPDGAIFGFSTSHTTRQPRPGEVHGQHYFFVSREEFLADVEAGKFLEHASVHNNLYGTSKMAVNRVLDGGKVCILDIDVQGARNLRGQDGLKAIFIFVAPPSLEDLARRLAGRGTETAEQMATRINNAKGEINSLNEKGLYDYLVVNDLVEEATGKIWHIANRARQGLDPEPGQVPEAVVIEDATMPEIADIFQGQPLGQRPVMFQQPSYLLDAPTPSLAGSTTHSAKPHISDLPIASQSFPASLSFEGMDKWRGRVALVTGASSGIGRAACEALAASGMHVVAVARRKDRLEELQRRMVEDLGIDPSFLLPVVCDVTKEAEVSSLSRIVDERWPDKGGISVLINNAGLSRNDAGIFGGSVESWVEMLSTNILGTCMVTRAVLQDMLRRGSYGHVINMVGLSGHRIPDGPQGGGFYCGTKSALKTITEGLRQEARGRGVPLRVTAISPGLVETEFFSVRSFGDPEAASSAMGGMKKALQPEDVARAMVWALSAPDHVEVNDIVVRPSEQML